MIRKDYHSIIFLLFRDAPLHLPVFPFVNKGFGVESPIIIIKAEVDRVSSSTMQVTKLDDKWFTFIATDHDIVAEYSDIEPSHCSSLARS